MRQPQQDVLFFKALARFLTWIPPLFFFPFLSLIGWRLSELTPAHPHLSSPKWRWLPRWRSPEGEGFEIPVTTAALPTLHLWSPPLRPPPPQGKENSSAVFPHVCTLCRLALPGYQVRNTLEPSQVPFIHPLTPLSAFRKPAGGAGAALGGSPSREAFSVPEYPGPTSASEKLTCRRIAYKAW